jgi:hypothetical protein
LQAASGPPQAIKEATMHDRAPFDLACRILLGPFALQWYGDGEPTWKQGRHRKPAKTSKQARTERRQLVKVLRRHGKGNDSALRLADILENCSKKHRCLSAACPVCSRAFQRWFVSAASSIVSRKKQWHVASLVWRAHRFPEGKLDPDTMFEALRRHLRVSLRRAEIRLAIGGFDISMNEHEDGKFVPHWRPHAWILVATKNPKRLRKHLKTKFPASKRVRRPLRIVRYDGSPTALAYALKTDFLRRVSLPRKRKSPSNTTRRNTRDRPLRSTQKIELALALHRIGLPDRVFQLGRASVLNADHAESLFL